jgi:Ca2+-binding RTX toxin-like protein
LSSFGIFGPGDGRLRTPVDVALGENYVYVADPGNYKIEKYTFEGISVASFDYNFGGYSVRPNGLIVDPDGNIYFTDSYKHRIIKIDPEGNTLKIFGSVGNDKGKFVEPKGIVLDDRGYLFVADFANNRIQKFETPIVMKIEEVLAAELAKKLEELTYEEESKDTDVVSNEEETITDVPPVRDLTNPILEPPRDITIEATGSFTAVNIGEAMAMDESGIQFLINNAPERFGLGTAIIIWTAIDNSGNSTIATQEVSVVDTIPPTISPVSDIIVEAAVPYENIVNFETPNTYDILGVMSITSNAPEFFPLGETIITWTATDVMGNTSTTEQKVIVVDNTSPILQAPEDIVIEATSVDNNGVDLGEANATDNGEIISISNDAPQFFALGDTIITWTVSDSSENVASVTQLVSVIDTTAPEILPVDDLTYEATSMDENIVYLDNPSVSDIQEVTITNDAPEFFPLGETLVTWTVTDVVDNTSTTEQKVIVVDTTSPHLTIPEDQIVEATSIEETLVEIGEAEAYDITGISSITNNAPEVFSLGSTVVTWTSIDSNGNTTTYEQTITVVDTTPPSIFVPADIMVEAVDPVLNFIELGDATTYDHVGIEFVTNDMPDSFSFGSTTVTWTVVDTSGNISKGTQIVTVIDTTIPEIVAPSDVIVEATGISNTVVEIGGATTYDIIQVEAITSDSPDTFPLGETVITWTATDSSGNSATATQTVTVVDTTAPSVTAPNSIEVEATSIDNTVEIGNPVYDDLVDIISVTSDSPDTFPLGETVITWTATDSSGNSATATQTVTVVDTTAPELIVPEDVIVDSFSLENLVEIGDADALDLVDMLPTITNDAPETFPLGDTIVTWNVSDNFGNSNSFQQVVSVQACGQSLSDYNQILGTSEDDILIGTDAPDLIFALGGNDIVFGGQGNDCIIGGEGDDIIFGNAGNDHLVGGEGYDIIKGNSGDDKLTGGLGFDVIDGGDDHDTSYDSASDIVIKCEEEL